MKFVETFRMVVDILGVFPHPLIIKIRVPALFNKSMIIHYQGKFARNAIIELRLDVSCGVGTQAIGLACKGFHVIASDLSERAIERTRREASARNLDISFSWMAVFRMRASLVGGCRPIHLEPYMDRERWQLEHRRVVTPFGVLERCSF